MESEKLSIPGERFGNVAFTPKGDRAFVVLAQTPGLLVFDAEGERCSPVVRGLTNLYSGDGTLNDSRGVASLTIEGRFQFVPGLMGQAFSLDGRHGFLQANWSAACTSCLESWTESLFVKLRSIDGEMTILERVSASARWGHRLIKPKDNHIVLQSGNLPDLRVAISSSSLVEAGRWYHLAVVTERDQISLYIDGALQGQLHLPSLTDPDADHGPVFLGASQVKRSLMNGLIDEVAWYDRALSADEVRGIFEARGHSPCEP